MPSTNRKKNIPTKSPARQKNRSQSNLLPIIGGIALLAVVLVLGILVASNQANASTASIPGLLTFAALERGHTNGLVTYAQNPPAGGQHNPAWQNCGVYSEPIQNENAVHSLEHGAIWITYQPDLPADQLEQLQTLTRRSGYRLLSPYPGLPAPIVASAWGYQVQLEQADDPRLLTFIRKYEQNPLGPEPGAACTGGVGKPG
ncbi:MAG: DUF3105 domain-containing protein [Anaerolineaceae bacterium]|nr:DUF3105 domain-containing protein [Anaerolineaceae bacterium]